MRRRQRLETGVWGRRKCTSMEPDSKGAFYERRKKNPKPKTREAKTQQTRWPGKEGWRESSCRLSVSHGC